MTFDGSAVLAILTGSIIILKVTLILALAGVVAFGLRRAAASLRHLVWSLALGASLVLPALALILPGWNVPGLERLVPAAESPAVDVWVESTPEPAAEKRKELQPVAQQFAAANEVAGATESSVAHEEPASHGGWASAEDASEGPTFQIAGDAGETFETQTNPSAAVQSFNSAPASPILRLPWTLGFVFIWIAGAALILAKIVFGILWANGMAHSGRVVRTGRLAQAAKEMAQQLGLRRRVKLIQSAGSAMPMTWGALRPVVLLPAEADAWSGKRLRAVLLHELAHVSRHDYLTQLVGRLTCAVHWFNPLVWLAARQLRHEREIACDDHVLRAGSRPSDYAGHLLEVARVLKAGAMAPAASVAMAHSSKLGERLGALLDARRERKKLSRARVTTVWLGALLLVLPLAAATAGAGSQEEEQAQEKRSSAYVTIGTRGVALGEIRVDAGPGSAVSYSYQTVPYADELATFGYAAVSEDGGVAVYDYGDPLYVDDAVGYEYAYTTGTDLYGYAETPAVESVGKNFVPFIYAFAGGICDWEVKGRQRRSTSINVDDGGSVRARIEFDDCRLNIDIDGTARFNDDESDILSISGDGSFEMEEKEGRESRRVVIDIDRNGELRRRWYVNGREQDFDDEAREWLAGMLPTMFRVTGIQAEERALRILTRGGSDALLTEISFISGDHTASKYYGVLLTQPDLDEDTYRRVVRQASEEISSDHSLAMLLLKIAEDHPMEASVQIAYVEASGSISSDHEQARVLRAILNRSDLSQEAADEMLARATEISSDHELAKLLIEFANTHRVDGGMATAYFAAVKTIDSDHETRKVLEAVLRQGAPSLQVLDLTLSTALSISSDHELGNLLRQTAELYPVDQQIPDSYMTAAGSIDSDHELRQVLSMLIQRGALSPAAQVSVLELTKTISSDHETSNVLRQFLNQYGLSDATRDDFFGAASTISSDHEQTNVLMAIIASGNLTDADVSAVLGAALSIGSDHSVTQVLVEVAESYELQGELREAYLRVADSVGSEHSRNKVLAAIVR